MKRTIEEIVNSVKRFQNAGLGAFQSMAAALHDEEWEDLIPLIERLQAFYEEHKK